MYDKLLQLPLFQGLGKNEFTQIIEKVKFHFHKLSPGTVLIKEGEACDKLIFILDGEVLSEAYNSEQKYTLQETLKAPQIIEPYSLFGMKPFCNATYSAATEAGVLTIGKNFLLENLSRYDIFMLNYLNILSGRAQMLRQKTWNMRIGNTYERIMHFLQMRCNSLCGPKTLLIKMEDFADLLTDTRINVSMALNDMQTHDVLKLSRKKISINDLGKLIEFCQTKKKDSEK